jgi:hypothetical protein
MKVNKFLKIFHEIFEFDLAKNVCFFTELNKKLQNFMKIMISSEEIAMNVGQLGGS